MTTTLPSREARLAAAKAARSDWTVPTVAPTPDVQPALVQLVRTHLGNPDPRYVDLTVSHRAFSALLRDAGITPAEWANDPDPVEVARRIAAAGHYVARGPRGGRYLARR